MLDPSPLEGREYGMKIAWIKIGHAVGEDNLGDERGLGIL